MEMKECEENPIQVAAATDIEIQDGQSETGSAQSRRCIVWISLRGNPQQFIEWGTQVQTSRL